jgi:hypothetical protein
MKTFTEELHDEETRSLLRWNAPVPGRVYTAEEAHKICEQAEEILKRKRD